MNKVKILTRKESMHISRSFREDIEQVSKGFKQFAHFSQFSEVSRDLREIPTNMAVRIDSSPMTHIGEITFGVNEDGSLTWLEELIDSSG